MGPLPRCATSPLWTCVSKYCMTTEVINKFGLRRYKNCDVLKVTLQGIVFVSSHDNKKFWGFFPLMPNRLSEKEMNFVWMEEKRKGPLETNLYQELKSATLWLWLWI